MAADLVVKVTVDDKGSVTKVKAFGRNLDKLAKSTERVSKSTDKLTRKQKTLGQTVSATGRKIQSAGAAMRTTGSSITMMAAPLGLAAAGAVKMAADFDTSMTKIQTLVGVAGPQVDEWREKLLAIGPELGKGPRELAEALFFITSAGIRDSADAIEVLTQAAKASQIGLGETKTVANALTSAVLAYGKEVLPAAEATRVLVATVREGKLEAEELAGSIGKVLPIASQLGVRFDDLGAFMATFTRLGVDSNMAAIALRQTLNVLIQGTPAQVKALDALGLSLKDIRTQIKEEGLAQALVNLVSKFKGNEEALREVIPNVRALTGVLGVAGKQSEAYLKIQGLMRENQDEVNLGFKRTTETVRFTFAEFSANIETLAVKLGTELAPALQGILTDMKPLIADITDSVKAFAAWSPEAKRTAVELGAFSLLLGPLVIVLGNLVTLVGGATKAFGALSTALGASALSAAVATILGMAGGTIALSKAVHKLAGFTDEEVKAQQRLTDTMNGASMAVAHAREEKEKAAALAKDIEAAENRFGAALLTSSTNVSALDQKIAAMSEGQRLVHDLMTEWGLSGAQAARSIEAGIVKADLAMEDIATTTEHVTETQQKLIDELGAATFGGMQQQATDLAVAIQSIGLDKIEAPGLEGMKGKLEELESVLGTKLPASLQTALDRVKALERAGLDYDQHVKDHTKHLEEMAAKVDAWSETSVAGGIEKQQELAAVLAKVDLEAQTQLGLTKMRDQIIKLRTETGLLIPELKELEAEIPIPATNEWGKSLLKVTPGMAKFKETAKKTGATTETAGERMSQALMDMSNAFNVLGVNAESTFGRILAGVGQLSAAIPAIGDKTKSILGGAGTASEKVAGSAGAAAQGVAGVIGATSSGSQAQRALGGAMAGAAAGGQIGGPIGAAVGAAVGAITGFLRGAGPKRKMKEIGRDYGVEISQGLAETIHSSGQDAVNFLGDIIAEGLEQGVSADELSGKLSMVFSKVDEGVITAAEGTQILDDAFQQLIGSFDEMGAAAQRNMIDTMKDAFSRGMETASMMDFLTQKFEEFTEVAKKGIDGTTAMFKRLGSEGVEATQEQFTAWGAIAGAQLQSLLDMGHTMLEALQLMGPALEAAIETARAKGLELEGPLANLVRLKNIASENEDLINAATSLGAVFDSLTQTGSLTQEMFNTLQTSAVNMHEELMAAGLTSNEALAQIAPFLAKAQMESEKFGVTIDENTQKLINEADAAGLLEGALGPQEKMLLLLERQVDVLEAMATALGATLPAAFGETQSAAEAFDQSTRGSDPWMKHVDGIMAMASNMTSFAGNIQNATGKAGKLAEAIKNIPNPPSVPGGGGGGGGKFDNSHDNGQRHAPHGLVIPRRPGGESIVAGERETELAAPVKALTRQMGADIAAALVGQGGGNGGGGQPIVVHVHLPGAPVYKHLERATKSGDLRVHPSAVQPF